MTHDALVMFMKRCTIWFQCTGTMRNSSVPVQCAIDDEYNAAPKRHRRNTARFNRAHERQLPRSSRPRSPRSLIEVWMLVVSTHPTRSMPSLLHGGSDQSTPQAHLHQRRACHELHSLTGVSNCRQMVGRSCGIEPHEAPARPRVFLVLFLKLFVQDVGFTRRATWCRWRWQRRRRHGQPCRGRWRA